ncbi:MAG: hypothetical protein J6U95_02830 [Alistipes sp.]|nr:hypothetical protein [Alistipes sp.]
MKLQKYACRIFAAMLIVATTACVDSDYRIDEVSGEVTLISGKTKVYVGALDQMTLGDLLGDTEVEGLEKDAEGNYAYTFSGVGETIKIEDFENKFTIPGTESSFSVEYPSFSLNMEGVIIDEDADIVVNTELLSQLGSATLPEALLTQIPSLQGHYSKTFSGDDMHLLFDVPEQVDNIKKITFKDIDANHPGAPLHLTVDFAGLAGVNGGGKVNIQLGLQGGKFRMLDANNQLVCEGNEYQEEYTIEYGADKLDFVLYIESVENTMQLNANHALDLPIELSCDVTFDINTKAGNFNLSEPPTFDLYADFEYGDAEIIVSNDAKIVEYTPTDYTKINITNLPKEVKAINTIEIADDATIDFYAHGLSWLGENGDKVFVEVTMPEYLILHAVPGAGYEYDEERHVLKTTISDINDGVAVTIDRLDFGSEGLVPDENGSLQLELGFKVDAYFAQNQSVTLSSLVHDGAVVITTGISEVDLSLKSISGVVDYSYVFEPEEPIALDVEGIDVEIGGLGLSPVITLNVENPLTIPLQLEGKLFDDCGREIELKTTLNPATYENGRVVTALNKVVIANKKPAYECIFVEVDFDEKLKGTLPSLIDFDFTVGVSGDTVQTFYMPEKLEINYDYNITIPVALNDKLSVSYAGEVAELNEIFTQLEGYNVRVGDVVVVAEVTNTTPLALEAQAELFNVDGSKSDAQVAFEEGHGRIGGSKDGVTPEVSTLRLALGTDGGNGIVVDDLTSIDKLTFAVSAASDAVGDVALRDEQYIAVKLWIEIDGGITIDINDFIASEESNE